MHRNIPILLTLLRVFLIPILIIVFYIPPLKYFSLICSAIFIIAAITDFFDGYLSRKWNQTTKFGAFLDPVSDKVLVAAALILIEQRFHYVWITIPSIIIISREIIVSALREWMAEIGKRSSVAVAWIGKAKTTTQMISIAILLADINQILNIIGIIALLCATFLTVWSLLHYLNSAKTSLI